MYRLGSPNETSRIESTILSMEAFPWNALYLAALGLFAAPILARLWGPYRPGWMLPVFLLAVLFTIRVMSVIMRKTFSFSARTQEVWSNRRELAERYDSYQWRKLLWIGLGLLVYAFCVRDLEMWTMVTAVTAVLAGGLGEVYWQQSRPDRTASTSLARS